MRPWIRRTLYGIFGATIVVGGLSACGHRHEHHGWNATAEEQAKLRGKVIDRVSSKLELNEAQKQKLGVWAGAAAPTTPPTAAPTEQAQPPALAAPDMRYSARHGLAA